MIKPIFAQFWLYELTSETVILVSCLGLDNSNKREQSRDLTLHVWDVKYKLSLQDATS